MKIYNLTLGQNKMVSAIINDLTKPYKAHANTQLYKQAGNSIVVNCLEAIFNGLERSTK